MTSASRPARAGATTALVLALGLAGLTQAGQAAAVGAAPAHHPTGCDVSTIRYSDPVTVPLGRHCTFTDVAFGGGLVVQRGAVVGLTRVAVEGDLRVDGGTVTGRRVAVHDDLDLATFARVALDESTVRGDVHGSAGLLHLQRSGVDGDVAVHAQAMGLSRVRVDGDVSVDGGTHGSFGVEWSRLAGALDVRDAAWVRLCGSDVTGRTTLTGASHSVEVGGGPAGACEVPSPGDAHAPQPPVPHLTVHLRGDLVVRGSTVPVDVRRTTVRGDLVCTDAEVTLTGVRVDGERLGTCAP